jgi:uncharacterized protein YegJ (DUF2314 family)
MTSESMDSEANDVPLFANLSEADPEILEAVSEARQTIHQFLEAVSKMRFSPAVYLVKVPFIDRGETGEQALVRTAETAAEHPGRAIFRLWLSVTSVFDDLIFCSVGEAPDALHLKRNTSFVIASEFIEDWIINQGGTVFGGFSLRVIRSRLRNEEQLRFDVHTGIREFKTLERACLDCPEP